MTADPLHKPMTSRRPIGAYVIRRGVVAAALLLLVAVSGSTRAAEPYREFLDGLRLRGYHEMALAYLDRIATRNDLPRAFAETLDYEHGITLEMAAGGTDDPGRRAQLLDRALVRLKSFAKAHPDHPLTTAARYRTGAVLATRAQLTAHQLDFSGDATDAERLAASARVMCDEAGGIYASLQQSIRDRLVAMPAQLDPVSDAGLIDERNRLRSHYVEVQLLNTAILQIKADTYAMSSPERLKVLKAAAAAYHQIYKKYASRLAGLYARLYEGRCCQRSGDLDAALAAYDELLALAATASPFLALKTEALKAALDCRLDDARQEYARAAEMGERWLAMADDAQLESSAAVGILERLAVAHRRLADENPQDVATAQRHRQRAAELERRAAQQKDKLSGPESNGARGPSAAGLRDP